MSKQEASDPAWWDAWRGVLFTQTSVMRAVERTFEERSGFPMTFLDVLGRLFDAPVQQLRMQELQARSLFTHSGMTRLVDRIEEAGLVRRERVPGDRRGVRVVLTTEGAEAYESGLAVHRADLEREFASRLTPVQHRAVADALNGFWHE